MELRGTIISAQNEPNKSGEGESFTVRFRDATGKDWVPFKTFHDSMKDKASALKGVVNGAKITIEKPEGKKFWDLISIEAMTAEDSQAVAIETTNRDAAIATQVAAKIVKDLWIADKLKDDNLLVVGLKKWLGTQLNAWPEKTPPVYADKSGNDPSKATDKHRDELMKLLELDPGFEDDQEEIDNQIALRFGYDAKMSDAECKDWIKELKTQYPPF